MNSLMNSLFSFRYVCWLDSLQLLCIVSEHGEAKNRPDGEEQQEPDDKREKVRQDYLSDVR